MRPIYWEDYLTDRLEQDEMTRDEAIHLTIAAFPYLDVETIEDEIDLREEQYAEMRRADRFTRGAEGGWADL